ncbi:DNA-binding transcriptional regulator, LysR family [Bosea sp. CRIB-10]|uniref:LysR family transcriptional regulator n=1 Tax=Bosea sp. CRIB-10 TaxID=378404 RepID=UPI0008E95429|nr:LysR family transcriptional regulator [Bosea sp. CRIB-10]SFD40138.1 DNA-binding transcriptional regulator, LysR family [Bosea sp. CRIB-10]
MDLNLLLLFAEIVETPNLSEAARRLGLSRSRVSQQLKTLERQIGAQLMRRTTRRVDLTDAGHTAYEHAIRLREDAGAAMAAIAGHRQHPRGHVRVSVPTGLGRLVLAPVLLDFLREHEEITLRVTFGNRIDDLVADNIDVAVRVLSTPPDTVVARELRRIAWRLCATPEIAARFDDTSPEGLRRFPFVAPPPSGRDYPVRLSRRGAVKVLATSPRLQAEDFLFMREALLAGMGAGLLPDYMADELIAAGRLVTLLPDYEVLGPGDRLFLLTTPTPHPAPAVHALVAHLRKFAASWPH